MRSIIKTESSNGATPGDSQLSAELSKLIGDLRHPVHIEDDETETPVAIAPCDIGPDDVLTFDFAAPIAERIVKARRGETVIYEATK